MKKTEAFAKINAMSGVVKLSDIINIILSIDNFKSDTLDKLNPAKEYLDGILLNDIYVDLTYQRKLRLQAVINRLITSGVFNKDVAGHIDIAVRPDGRKFVWDGFHRCIMAALSALTKITASEFIHDKSRSESECRILEAKMFKIRNADQTKMEPGEIFKSEVVYNDETALEQLELLKKCKLDVEGTNPDVDAYSLGGFGFFKRHWKNYSQNHIVDSADIIRETFDEVKTLSVQLLFGLAALLDANENDVIVKTVSISEIKDKFKTLVKDNKMKQKDVIGKTIKHFTAHSIAVNILKMGVEDCFNDNGNEVKSLIKYLEIDDDDVELLSE